MDKRTKSISVSGGSLPDGATFTIAVTVDYTNVERDELIERALSNDVIRLQRTLRTTDIATLKSYVANGYNVDGATIGTGKRSVDPIAALMAAGYTREVATFIVNNAQRATELLNETTNNNE